jgi:hypothetical protein
MPSQSTDKNRFFSLLKRAGDPLVKAKKKKDALPDSFRGYTETETPPSKKADTSD